MPRRWTGPLLLAGGVVAGIATGRALYTEVLLARGCTEDMGYRLNVDGATITRAGCALDRGGQVVVVPLLPLAPSVIALAAALACFALAGLGFALTPGVRTRRTIVFATLSAAVAICLGWAGLWWWRGRLDQQAVCHDRLGGAISDGACRVGEHGAVPVLPAWPTVAVLLVALLVIALAVARLLPSAAATTGPPRAGEREARR